MLPVKELLNNLKLLIKVVCGGTFRNIARLKMMDETVYLLCVIINKPSNCYSNFQRAPLVFCVLFVVNRDISQPRMLYKLLCGDSQG